MRRALLVAAGLLLGALALSAIEGAGLHVRHAGWGDPVPWTDALLRPLPHWLLMAALAPLVILLASRVRIRRGAWWWLPIHAAGAVAFATLHVVLGTLAYRALLGTDAPVGGVVISQLAFDFTIELVSYVALVVGTEAWLWHADARRERETASDARRRLAEARLALLRSRLHPHFLFNTLQAIAGLALKGERDEVVVAIARLSDVLRASLEEGGAEEIPLSRELEILDSYLAIQKLRFGERLAIEREIERDALGALVPALLLQPIVENAIDHGIARAGRGTVALGATIRDGRLELRVEDDGPGPSSEPREGVGLSVTRERLNELYGDRQRLALVGGPRGGTCVVITIPWRAAAPHAARGREEPAELAGAPLRS